jgi:hypothetical protein
MRFQREMPGVEEADNCSWDVARESLAVRVALHRAIKGLASLYRQSSQ